MGSSKQVKIGLSDKSWSIEEGLTPISILTCVFYRKYSVISTYVDDCVIVLHKQETTKSLIESLNNGPKIMC